MEHRRADGTIDEDLILQEHMEWLDERATRHYLLKDLEKAYLAYPGPIGNGMLKRKHKEVQNDEK